MSALGSKLTVLVNSCDKYSDLWNPFFTLYKKYASSLECPIILNTESIDFSFEGLDIKCIHLPDANERNKYSARMSYCLSKISSEYVLVLLDDFFLRESINIELIQQIIEWMDKDKRIVYFNCDNIPVYYDEWEKDKYPGFHRVPCGNCYTLNLQAAIWRTKKLRDYWRSNSIKEITPWEWEIYTNIIAANKKNEKFYCTYRLDLSFCNYGYNPNGMGVFRGKWVYDDVFPLFKKEGIYVDFSKRGFYTHETKSNNECPNKMIRYNEMPRTTKPNYTFVERVLGKKYKKKYQRFVKKNQVLNILNCSMEDCFFEYCLYKARVKVKKKIKREERIEFLKKEPPKIIIRHAIEGIKKCLR